MKPRYLARLVLLSCLCCGPTSPVANAAEPTVKRILFFTKSSGFEHSVIKQVDGKPSHAEGVLQKLAPQHQFQFTMSKDGSLFSAEYLKQFDAVLFYTSGDLLHPGTDGRPPMTPEGKQALLAAIDGGLGFVGLHSASDTFHTGESGGGNPQRRRHRYRNYGDDASSYVKCLGGEFIRHGPQQVATARVTDRAFPGYGNLGDALTVREEWYSLKEFAPDLRVQLVMETSGMDGSDYARPPYPIAWARQAGKGRVAFNAMGHREDVWDSAAFQAMLVGMLEWASGRTDADLASNLKQVAPDHATLPAPPADMP